MFNLIIRVCLVREGRIIQIVRCMLDFLLFLLTLFFFLKFLIDQVGLKLAMNDLELSPRPSPLEHWTTLLCLCSTGGQTNGFMHARPMTSTTGATAPALHFLFSFLKWGL